MARQSIVRRERLPPNSQSTTSSSAVRKRGRSKTSKKPEVVSPPVLQEDKFIKLEKSLIPGIPNQITLDEISTKIPWDNLRVLALLSRGWRQAVQDRLVHDARVRLHATQTVIVVNHVEIDLTDERKYSDSPMAISLYSIRDQNFYHLSPIPPVFKSILWDSQCILSAGKLYILGGGNYIPSREVYVRDLTGQQSWKQCAQMQVGRKQFGCGVLDGKIYVFGGISGPGSIVESSEVYDPNTDAWSLIKPIPGKQFNHVVTTVGDELYVYGGWQYVDNYWGNYTRRAPGLKAYHPGQNKWKVLMSSKMATYPVDLGKLFVAHGKVYCMSLQNCSICVYDFDNKSWKELHRFSPAAFQTRHGDRLPLEFRAYSTILPLDNELLALVSGRLLANWTPLLMKSKGFNSENTEFLWEEIPFPFCREETASSAFKSPFMSHLQF